MKTRDKAVIHLPPGRWIYTRVASKQPLTGQQRQGTRGNQNKVEGHAHTEDKVGLFHLLTHCLFINLSYSLETIDQHPKIHHTRLSCNTALSSHPKQSFSKVHFKNLTQFINNLYTSPMSSIQFTFPVSLAGVVNKILGGED